jgi:hypothetical protein
MTAVRTSLRLLPLGRDAPAVVHDPQLQGLPCADADLDPRRLHVADDIRQRLPQHGRSASRSTAGAPPAARPERLPQHGRQVLHHGRRQGHVDRALHHQLEVEAEMAGRLRDHLLHPGPRLPRCPAAPLPRCPAAPLPRCPAEERRSKSGCRGSRHPTRPRAPPDAAVPGDRPPSRSANRLFARVESPDPTPRPQRVAQSLPEPSLANPNPASRPAGPRGRDRPRPTGACRCHPTPPKQQIRRHVALQSANSTTTWPIDNRTSAQ